MSATALERAQSVTGVGQAAKLRDKFLTDLSFGEPSAADDDKNAAVDQLEQRFPELKELEPGEGETYGQTLRASSRSYKGTERARPAPAKTPAGGRASTSSARTGGAGAGRTRSRSAGRSSGRASRGARRTFERTGIPGAARSTTSLVLQGLGMLVGLSFAYLLLTNSEKAKPGRSALELFGRGVSKGVAAIINPVDPLQPGGPVGTAAAKNLLYKPGSAGTGNIAGPALSEFGTAPAPAVRVPLRVRQHVALTHVPK